MHKVVIHCIIVKILSLVITFLNKPFGYHLSGDKILLNNSYCWVFILKFYFPVIIIYIHLHLSNILMLQMTNL